jgi:hypothetical protein
MFNATTASTACPDFICIGQGIVASATFLAAQNSEVLHVDEVPVGVVPAAGPLGRSPVPFSVPFLQSLLVWPLSPHSQHLTDAFRSSRTAGGGLEGTLGFAGAARGMGLGLRSSNFKAYA